MTAREHADIDEWIRAASADPIEHRRRQAVEVLIRAISTNSAMRETLYLKGGALMNILYNSPRLTTDIDFTTLALRDGFRDRIVAALNHDMNLAALDLRYTRFRYQVQTTEMRPPQPEFPWPTLLMTIGFATRGSREETMLARGQSPWTLRVDISFNETVYDSQEIEITDPIREPGADPHTSIILAYSPLEVIAEKLRAILQQKIRNRYRRQDIYDIARLASARPLTPAQFSKVFEIFLAKCRDREIEPTIDMIGDRELYQRSRERYGEMRLDRGGSSFDFEADFAQVAAFYRAMPWPSA
jgi:predicted nucleotidyltransferase component of viral defense system